METERHKGYYSHVMAFLPYLWGMETFGGVSAFCKDFLVLTVPMRNGNPVNAITIHISPLSFLPYLWGMETSRLWIWTVYGRGWFLPYLWGMETGSNWTGLWLKTVLTVPMRNGNSFSLLNFKSFLIVLTVPMRNGNWSSLRWTRTKKPVLTVPMRNGNDL